MYLAPAGEAAISVFDHGVLYGAVANAKRKRAGPMAVVLDDALFEEVAVLPAFTRAKTRHVYRYRGGAGSGESSP